ncbi:nucleoprotein [Orinoco virus]|uniref:Nucleoprotein n=1 Tax=Orinoco virus TaxID=1871345 RepID=A0A1B1FIU5_9MONO|nr:nucleoprotein [Orinoco virus]ANQ45643.1 nucleoprotein [Orinoco virus]
MTTKFSNWGEIESTVPVSISLNIVEVITLAVNKGMLGLIQENELLSSAYWLLGLEDDKTAKYITATVGERIPPTAAGRQTTAYVALCIMMGYVKELTKDNYEAASKRWKAGLASQNLTDMVEEPVKTSLWTHILTLKIKVYSRSDKREALLRRFLAVGKNLEGFPPTMRAVHGQLQLIYDMAYLKSVVCMQDFIHSGNPALLLLHVRKEAREFQEVIGRVQAAEGQNFHLCRLLDNTKYPELNHSKYPDLYAVTLQWARKTKRVQKNYLGSKAITDRSLDIDMAKHLISLKGASKVPTPSEEDARWLESVGCSTKIDEVRRLMGKGSGSKRRRGEASSASESEASSESEAEADEEPPRRRSGKHRRH